jgi:hypothetical protein
MVDFSSITSPCSLVFDSVTVNRGMAQVVMTLTCILEEHVSNFDRDTVVFLIPERTYLGNISNWVTAASINILSTSFN